MTWRQRSHSPKALTLSRRIERPRRQCRTRRRRDPALQSRCPLLGVKRTWVGHIYAARSSFCPSPQNAKERKLHEHQRYVSRCFPWQQNQPKNDGMELPSRSGTAGKGKGGNCRVEGMGRKAPGRDRRHGWTARQDQEDHSTRDRRYKQRHGRLHGRAGGIKRGGREAVRKPSALRNLPRRSRGGNAGLAHTWCLICGSARETANERTVREKANTIALTD